MGTRESELEGGWQPTQLLQTIIDTKLNLGVKSGVPRSPVNVHDHMHADVPSDSLSRRLNSLPVYHFHGLAATQSPTPQDKETFESNEGSQKENISASVNGIASENNAQTFEAPPKAPTVRVPADQAILTVTKPESTYNSPVSFKPPSTTTGPNKTTSSTLPSSRASTTYHTTSSPAVELDEFSQDSFAGAISQDPEQQFLAVSKKFEIPLSQLERVVSSPDHSTGPIGRVRPVGSMFSYSGSKHNARRPSPQPAGRVLVAATPSNSDGSQTQHSQLFDDFQGHGQEVDYGEKALDGDDVASQRSTQGYESSFPSSSYERLLNGERDPDANDQELQATQPCTQQDTDMPGDHDGTHSEGDADDRVTSTNTTAERYMAHTEPTSSTNPHPRSLLSMVDPKHKWRYQKFQDNVPGLPHAQNPPAPQQTVHAAIPIQETQPAFQEDEGKEPPRRQFRKPTGSTASPSTLNTDCRVPPLMLENNDQMDIVPDSEPLRGDSTSRTSRNTTHSPTKKLVRLNSDSSDAGPNSGEILSDSMLSGGHDGAAANDRHGKRPDEVPKPLHSGKEQGIVDDDDDDDDDEVPLAITRGAKARGSGGPTTFKDPELLHPRKGKAPALEGQSKQRKMATKPSSGAVITDQNEKTTTPLIAVKRGGNQSWETKAIPSSIPGEEMGKALPSGRLRANPKPAKSTVPRRGGAKGPPRATRGRVRNGSVHDEQSHSEASVKEEDGTEPADDDYVEDDHPVAGPSTRKRKRGAPATKPATSRIKSKASTRTTKHPSVTPVTRQAKRLRTASVNKGSLFTPTRVFALWRQDGHYYSGVVHAHEGGPRYVVVFDDETKATVNIDQMRLCELRVGDNVLLPNSTRNYKVADVAKFDSDNTVGVLVDDEIEELRISDIIIANKTIAYAWKDRTLTSDSIVTVTRPVKPSPTPSKFSITSGPSARSNLRKVLARTGLVITLSSSNSKWEKDKESIMAAVKNTGGTVIDDWASIFRMEGKHSHSNNRWVIEKSDVKWIGKDDIEKVFLLADNANQKPKFLIALALGIPCVCVSWLHDSVSAGEDKEWQAYLLPQGYSDALHARPSQQIDMDWGNSVHQLTNIMDTSVACKLFDEKSILCVGPEMVPQPKGKKLAGNDEKVQDAHNAVVRIILSMGARRVEAVSELKYASAPVSEFDLVVIKEAHHYDPALDNGCTVHWTWVKDCLVASRQLPLPAWGLTNSQEA